jgi:predicted MPP superfamily phosphohydrolase
MRAFSTHVLLLFLLFYCLINALGYLTVKTFARQTKNSRLISAFYLGYTIIIIGVFLSLYIYPFSARKAVGYSIYIVFNLFLVGDLIIKTILALFTLVYHLFKAFKKERLSIIYIPLILITGILTTILWSSLFGNKSIYINKVNLSYRSLPQAFDNFRIVQISDIHLGSFIGNRTVLNHVNKIINSYKPDLLLFSGDLVNNFAKETQGWNTAFDSMYSKKGRFAVMGNHDYGNYHKWDSEDLKRLNLEQITEAYNRFGFRLLRNESVTIKEGKDSIFLIGVENWGLPPFPQSADLNKAMDGIPKDGFMILLSHDPAHWAAEIKGKKPIQLTLSGHTHGAQWGLKLGGIEFSPIYLERNQWAGLYGQGEQLLNVNRGLGTVGINYRLDMPCEVTIITLKMKAD